MVIEHTYELDTELEKIRTHQQHRAIPEKTADKVLIASWNIRQLTGGSAMRDQKDYRLIAEILKPFDIIAVQEVKDNLGGLRAVMQYMPDTYRARITDRAGNYERLAFIYDTSRIQDTELAGELVLLQRERDETVIEGVDQPFVGFNRNPFQVSFKAGNFDFVLVNVHTYYGSATRGSEGYNQRLLETYALSRWASTRVRSRNVYDSDIILIGDFNLPKMDIDDPIYEQLTSFGLRLPKYSTEMGTDLGGIRDYDQIAFFPDNTDEEYGGVTGVFDFDKALFSDLWNGASESDFKDFVKYHISDHRLLWASFNTGIPTGGVMTAPDPPETPETKVTSIPDMAIFNDAEKAKLKEAGITNTTELLERLKTHTLRDRLRRETGIKSKRLNDIANYVDLMRVSGITQEYAVLLEAVGVDSVPELGTRNPDNLFNNSITPYDISSDPLVTQKPTAEQVREWVAEAKTLERAIEY